MAATVLALSVTVNTDGRAADAPANPPDVSVTGPDQEASFLVVNRRIDNFLNELAREQGIRIHHSDSVRGRITNASFIGDVEDLLETLSDRYNLDWFSYNGVYFVSHQKEAATRMIRLGDLSVEDALSALEKSELVVDRFPIKATAEDAVLSVTAPPYMVAIIESIIEGIPSEVPQPRAAEPKNFIRIRRALEVEHVPIN